MKRVTTKEKIIHALQNSVELRAGDLAKCTGVSRQAIHKQLKMLVECGIISKKGVAPQVFYFLKPTESRIEESKKIFALLLNSFVEQTRKKGVFWTVPEKNTIDLHFLLRSSALFSSKIEGNTLDINSFMNKAEVPRAKKREMQEIDDLQKAYEFARIHALTADNFLQTHKILSKQFLSISAQGVYRTDKVGVFSGAGLEYRAIEPQLVQSEMNELFATITPLLEQNMTKEEVYIWSLYIHAMIAFIHPFADGNGRAARLIEKWFLAEKLGGKYWYIQSEKFYWDNLEQYYKSLSLGVNYWEVDFRKIKKFVTLHL